MDGHGTRIALEAQIYLWDGMLIIKEISMIFALLSCSKACLVLEIKVRYGTSIFLGMISF